MTVRAALCGLFIAAAVVVAHGQYDSRPAPGLTHPREVRTGGWSYEYYTIDAGTGSGDWPSCGGVLDLRAGERSVSGSLVFGTVTPAVMRTKPASGSAVSCVEAFVPQAACTVKVFVETEGPVFHQLTPHTSRPAPALTTSGLSVGVAVSPATGDVPGCYVQLRNWSGQARTLLIAWPPA